MNFRADINGLRAIAVIAVVLFHFNPSYMPGGFAGVDVFFVISGFLMTKIIFSGIEKESFNLFRFYNSRANRIIPALAFLCLILLFFGVFCLTPLDFQKLGKHISSSMGFISNITYRYESGYFDVASHKKWLLHTWSLSVEWQFYIIYPLVLVICKKFLSIESIKKLLLFGTIVGFAYCVLQTIRWPTPAYYLLHSRAWEMMLGGLAFLYPFSISIAKRKCVEILGVALISFSYAFFSSETPWPGHLSLFPTLGAYLILIANRQDSFLTNNPLFQLIGKWSYSIYLWHWPIVVFGIYYGLGDSWWVVGLLLSLLAGCLSFTFIESLRLPTYERWKDIFKIKPIWFVLCLSLMGIGVYQSTGLLFLYGTTLKSIVDAKYDTNPRSKECFSTQTKCTFGEGKNIAILVGDSHAMASASAISKSISSGSLAFYGHYSCQTMFGHVLHNKSRGCNEFNDWFKKDIADNNLPIIIINSGAYPVGADFLSGKSNEMQPITTFQSTKNYEELFVSNYVDTVCGLALERSVHLVRPYPRMQDSVPEYMLKHENNGTLTDYSVNRPLYADRHRIVYKAQDMSVEQCGVNIIDVIETLCDESICFGSVNLIPIYSDNNHLTEHGADLLIPLFKKHLP